MLGAVGPRELAEPHRDGREVLLRAGDEVHGPREPEALDGHALEHSGQALALHRVTRDHADAQPALDRPLHPLRARQLHGDDERHAGLAEPLLDELAGPRPRLGNDEGHPAQVLERDLGEGGDGMRRRGDQHQFIGADRLDQEAPVLDRPAHQPHVEHVLQELVEDLIRGADVEEDVGLRPEPLVRLDDARQDVHPAGGPGAEDQPPSGAVAQLRDRALRLLLGVEHGDGGAIQHLARLGQPELGASALEQRKAELLLERLELQAHRGLAQQEVRRRRRDAATLGHRVEDPEVVEVHCIGNS